MTQTDLAPEETADHATNAPLCVDLDGTLACTDTLMESLVAGVHNRRVVRGLVLWFLLGRARLKRELAQHAHVDPALIPYNTALLKYLGDQRERGRRLILTTAADRTLAERIASHLGLFDAVLASDGRGTFRGADKARALTEHFGERQFSYAGSDFADVAVWRSARTAVLVNTPRRIERTVRAMASIEHRIDDRPSRPRALLRTLRPHQWSKNLLVFVPLITANAWGNAQEWLHSLLIFLAFCATASAIYIVNDLTDLSADRKHPRKRNRPLASGALPIAGGLAAVPVLFTLGALFAVASRAPLLVLLYAFLSLGYSFKLKEMPLIDVFVLAGLYTLRLFAGGEASGHRVSLWLLAFSSFLFLSLAIIKRVAELLALRRLEAKRASRRGYSTDDIDQLRAMGTSASFTSSMVLALYVQNEVIAQHYAHPYVLWLIVPLLLFWQCRLWLATTRGVMLDDPIIYSAKDWVSWLVGLTLTGVLTLAHLPL